MPFMPGEQVNLRFEGDPTTARLDVGGVAYTVANGGLEPKPDGGLIVILQLPYQGPANVDYVFTDGARTETGRLRVLTGTARPGVPSTQAQAATPSPVALSSRPA